MSNYKNAKPFLKWAGGKKQIKTCIEEYLPQHIRNNGKIKNYCEPFLGGGAIFFHLISEYKIEHAYLSDINKDLILTYEVVKREPEELISTLHTFAKKFNDIENRKIVYYDTRKEFNTILKDFDYDTCFEEHTILEEHIIRASQMIFLNRTCFNGLYRVNKSGEFNVPIGSYKNPIICDEDNIRNVSKILNNNVEMECKEYDDYDNALINENSFFYLDPPYFPIKKDSFTNYNSKDFGLNEQIELSQFCKKLDDNNVKFILSNSNMPIDFFNKIYGNLGLKTWHYEKIDARRSINSKGNKRGPIKELLIFNY